MANDQQRSEDDGGGLSRRQVLARGAVAAGVVWAAPVIRSASAYATSAAGTERPCSKFYLVCIDQLGARPVRFVDDRHGYDEMPSAATIAKFRPIPGPAPPTTTSSTSTTTTSSTSSTTTSSTSSTTTSSTSSTSTTSTTRAFKDPTAGLGIFPDDEATADPRDKKKDKEKDKKDRDKKRKTTTTTGPATDPGDALTEEDPNAPLLDDLGLFPAEPDPNAPVDPAATVPSFDALPPGIESWLDDNPDVPVRYPDVPPMLTQTGDQAWAVLLPAVEDGPNPDTHQCRAVKGWGHSAKRYASFYVDPHLAGTDEENLRLIFPSPTMEDGNPGPIDLVFLVYCCP